MKVFIRRNPTGTISAAETQGLLGEGAIEVNVEIMFSDGGYATIIPIEQFGEMIEVIQFIDWDDEQEDFDDDDV